MSRSTSVPALMCEMPQDLSGLAETQMLARAATPSGTLVAPTDPRRRSATP
jgi:hypothetical protein